MKDRQQIGKWLYALGGTALADWMNHPERILWLWGPPATGKTLFEVAWKQAGKRGRIITSNTLQGAPNTAHVVGVLAEDAARFVKDLRLSEIVAFLRSNV